MQKGFASVMLLVMFVAGIAAYWFYSQHVLPAQQQVQQLTPEQEEAQKKATLKEMDEENAKMTAYTACMAKMQTAQQAYIDSKCSFDSSSFDFQKAQSQYSACSTKASSEFKYPRDCREELF